MEEPLIKIPEKNTPVTGMPEEVKNRFDKIDTILITVVVAIIIALISIVVAVFGIFLDQMRYNNAAYKEYSEKIGTVENTQKINQQLLEQNQKNQAIIIEQQESILKLIK
ncbi:MAG: hypothetical protein UR31_C0002G0012 [Parcubacteria group bacterium GW2011_GWA2_33_14]|uniref:Uncharacterized protein n=1 Tax=Candidatus Staskawiczbacteria bacterium RIFCSPHIGHO2_02_FULL_33_16 TaxID=1802204 RepID=A0A1G2HXH3_9BACT|nr:MAG: hypothetical protein UR31_C0002G0012 [Parcubacteria group bacterium GW2011_GWA2_33_14]OGZ66528.1 MAG: hypothetical protein A3D34_00655 [Candidatus Staskawiczbacteria bacterium RIFCSPHIGHO2_02_FULL_33_16]